METTFHELERALFGLPPRVPRYTRFFHAPAPPYPTPTRVDAWDTGTELVLRVQVPGLGADDIQLTYENGVLTLSGESRADVPEGYTALRRERGARKFSRSLRLGVKVDADKAEAVVHHGVLTVRLPKSAEAQARPIPIQTR